MTKLSRMSGPKLTAHVQELEAAYFATVQEFCDAGRGHLRHSDVAELAKQGDEMAKRQISAYSAWRLAFDELDERRRYHGGTQPIRRFA